MPDRRHFLKAFAAVPAAAAAAADEPPPAPSAAQALTDLVRARFGRHLDAAQLRAAQDEVEHIVRLGEMLRRAPLDDADEPPTLFVPEPPE